MKREESLGYVVNHVARQMARALRDAIAPYGVVPGQFAQLLALYEQDQVTQQELSEIVEVEQPTMANTLRRMERDGLIERVSHPDDGRKQLIVLTDRARDLEADLTAAAQRVNDQAMASLSDAQRRTILRLLHEVSGAVDGDNDQLV